MPATPEQTMSEQCVTITLERYNELIEAEENLNEHNRITTGAIDCSCNASSPVVTETLPSSR